MTTRSSPSDAYPEHAKLAKVAEQSQAIGEFLDYTRYSLCEWIEAGNNGEPPYVDFDGNGSDTGGIDTYWNPAFESWDGHFRVVDNIQNVLAEYFEIDLDEIEREKRVMLDVVRSKS